MEHLFQHLRWGFNKIEFHADAADACPALLAAQDVVHQMPELVKEGFDVVDFHEPRVAGAGRGEVAYQRGLRQLLTADAVEHQVIRIVGVFTRPRVHVEVKTPDRLAAIEDTPGFDRRIPGRSLGILAKRHVK